jgi:hypothetical protein
LGVYANFFSVPPAAHFSLFAVIHFKKEADNRVFSACSP